MPRTLVGLDIGTTGVRAAELVPGRRRPTLRRFASVPLPPGVVRAGVVLDPDALAGALRALWSQGRFGTRRVSIGIANAGVLVRQLDLDWMPPGDFRKALRYQVQDVLPMSVDDAILDHHLLEELEVEGEQGPRKIARVLLVAAARETVESFVGAARSAGLRPVGVDLLPFALLRTRAAAGFEELGTTEAIIDIGADVVTVVVHTDGVPRYVRMIPGLGGDTVTRAVQEHYDWTWEEAENTKVYVGLPGHAHLDELQRAAVFATGDGTEHPAQQVVAAAAAGLAAEIGNTLAFYDGSTESEAPSAAPADRVDPVDAADTGPDGPVVGPRVTRLLLAGAGARLAGLAELLEERLDVPVRHLDAAGHLRARARRLPEPDEAHALAVPAGLCVGGVR